MTVERDAPTPRQERILQAVCRVYLTSGQPVSSGVLVERHGLPWSSATLRAELATLERIGLLHQPHTSAGRVPTSRGLQRYVDAMARCGEADANLARAVDRSLSEVAADTDHRLRAAAWVLSEAVDGLAVSFVGQLRDSVVRDVELVPLLGRRALVVLAMADGATRVHPVTIEGASDDGWTKTCAALQERLRWLCRNRTLAEARARVVQLMREQECRVDGTLAEVLRIGMLVCGGAVLDPLRLHVVGQSNLVRKLAGEPELAATLALLEDYQRLAEVLFQLVPDGPHARVHVGAIAVHEGRDMNVGAMALVGCRLPVGGGEAASTAEAGAIAVLGPQRMDFAAIVPLVEYAARALASPACA